MIAIHWDRLLSFNQWAAVNNELLIVALTITLTTGSIYSSYCQWSMSPFLINWWYLENDVGTMSDKYKLYKQIWQWQHHQDLPPKKWCRTLLQSGMWRLWATWTTCGSASSMVFIVLIRWFLKAPACVKIDFWFCQRRQQLGCGSDHDNLTEEITSLSRLGARVGRSSSDRFLQVVWQRYVAFFTGIHPLGTKARAWWFHRCSSTARWDLRSAPNSD